MNICSSCKSAPVVNSSKCRPCYNAYMTEYQKTRYKRRRDEAISSLGGCCVRCSSTENLELDHIVASTKEYDIGKILGGGSEAKVQAELAKCQVLCHDCHVQKSHEEGDTNYVEHGGGLTGKRNCRCELCAPLKNAYMREKKFRKAAKERAKLAEES